MSEIILGKMCIECQKPCTPIPCISKPEASEFYCHICHKSYPMELEIAKHILNIEARTRK